MLYFFQPTPPTRVSQAFVGLAPPPRMLYFFQPTSPPRFSQAPLGFAPPPRILYFFQPTLPPRLSQAPLGLAHPPRMLYFCSADPISQALPGSPSLTHNRKGILSFIVRPAIAATNIPQATRLEFKASRHPPHTQSTCRKCLQPPRQYRLLCRF